MELIERHTKYESVAVLTTTRSLFLDTQALDLCLNTIRQSSCQIAESRLNNWLAFFNEHFHLPEKCFYQYTIQAVLEMSTTFDSFLNQTGFEVEMSQAFYSSFLQTEKQLMLSDVATAKKLFACALLFGKYPGMFLYSTKRLFADLEDKVTEMDVQQCIQKALVKYEIPEYIFQHIEMLNSEEIQLLMSSLQGKNQAKHEIFPIGTTKHHFSQLMSLKMNQWKYQNNIFLRGLIQVSIQIPNSTIETFEFLRYSTTFKKNPNKFFVDIGFWKAAYRLFVQREEHFHHVSVTDYVDFLEFKKYHSEEDYSLKGRTSNSLCQAIQNWHNRVFDLRKLNFEELTWKGQEKENFVFQFENKTYESVQLLNGKELAIEGKKLQHCASTYAHACSSELSYIWSLRIKKEDEFVEYLTIEVSENRVVQARGLRNKPTSNKQLAMVQYWAQRMEFAVDLY